MRKIIVSGRLAANAEAKNGKTGNQYVEFRMANNEYNGSSDGNGNDTYWFRVVGFNPNLVKLIPYLTKGKPVEVIGTLQVSPYINKTTNLPEAGLEITANDIMFDNNFGSKQDNAEPHTAPTAATAAAPAEPKKPAPRNPTTAVPKVAQIPAPTATADDSADDDLPF